MGDVERIELGLSTPYDPTRRLSRKHLILIEEYSNLADEQDRLKYVYAAAGLALYEAQCFEQNLQILLLLESQLTSDPSRRISTLQEWDALDQKLGKNTCGALLTEVLKRVDVDPKVLAVFDGARTTRNDIAHHFFLRHAANIVNETGRMAMVTELAETCHLFDMALFLTDTLMRALFKCLGFTDDKIERIQGEALRRATEGR